MALARTNMKPVDLQLWTAYQSDRSIENRNALVERYYHCVVAIALKFRRKMPRWAVQTAGDLMGYGAVGLLQAIEKFDPSRGLQFQTYATRAITGRMIDGLRNEEWAPRSEFENANSRKRILYTSLLPQRGSFERKEDWTDDFGGIEFRELVGRLCEVLPEREQLVFQRRFVEGRGVGDIAREFRVTKQRASQIALRAVARLRNRFGEDGSRLLEKSGEVA